MSHNYLFFCLCTQRGDVCFHALGRDARADARGGSGDWEGGREGGG